MSLSPLTGFASAAEAIDAGDDGTHGEAVVQIDGGTVITNGQQVTTIHNQMGMMGGGMGWGTASGSMGGRGGRR